MFLFQQLFCLLNSLLHKILMPPKPLFVISDWKNFAIASSWGTILQLPVIISSADIPGNSGKVLPELSEAN